MPSTRTLLAVAAVVAVAAVGGVLVYGESGSSRQTYESPANLTYPDGVGFDEESLAAAREFAATTERDVVGAPPAGDPETRVYVCEDAFCLDVTYPREDGASRAFYYVSPNETVRLPHDAAVRDAPPDGPRQRIFLVNPTASGRSVDVSLVKWANGTGTNAGSAVRSVGAGEVTLLTVEDLDPDAVYEATYDWRDDAGREHAFSLEFEPGNHSDAVWIFEG